MAQEGYIYAVTRVHAHEANLLSGEDIQAMIAADNTEAVLRLLAEKGWGAAEDKTAGPSGMIDAEMAKTWALVSEMMEDLHPFDVFRVANDYHNLKAAIKLAYTGGDQKDAARYAVGFGSIDLAVILKAAMEHDFTALPPAMAEAGRQAYETLAQTGNGQACDMVIDRASLVAIDEAGKSSESELLQDYARLRVDAANIKAAVRCARMGKNEEFVGRAIAPAGSLNTGMLAAAAVEGEKAVHTYLRTTRYASAVDALERSMAAFESWCDNQLVELIRPQRHNYFSIEPLAAYILARQNEVTMVRIILSAKQNGLGNEVLEERLREMYV